MDLISLYYFKELTMDLNMTSTADRLFISQQTLSNHILRLEKEYGLKLFERKPKLLLTDAGNLLLKFADTTLNQEKELRKELEQLKNSDLIRFGASTFRANNCIPVVLSHFNKRYPKTEIRLTDAIGFELEKKLLNRELDLILCTEHPDISGNLEAVYAVTYKIYLCATNQLLYQYYGAEAENLKRRSQDGAQVRNFSKLPFLYLTGPNVLGLNVERCFQEAGYTPLKYMSTAYTHLSIQICSESRASCFISQTALQSMKNKLSPDINIFPLFLEGKQLLQTMLIVRNKTQYLSPQIQYLIKLLKQHFMKEENLDLAHLAPPLS